MRVHHLNCATLCPRGTGFLVNAARKLICHCLLIETDGGLVLVDTGFGTADLASPYARLGADMVLLGGPRLDVAETAIRQIERLGLRPEDVKHVVPTHLDLDHGGGIPDFPWADVHVHEVEHRHALARPSFRERRRYRLIPYASAAKWVVHRPEGETWNGFESVRAVPGTKDEVLLIPLFGHTHGHCGVAVNTPDGWLLHAGDAYFHADEMHPTNPSCSAGLAIFQRALEMNRPARLANQVRLRELKKSGAARVFCAHDPTELEAFTRGAP